MNIRNDDNSSQVNMATAKFLLSHIEFIEALLKHKLKKEMIEKLSQEDQKQIVPIIARVMGDKLPVLVNYLLDIFEDKKGQFLAQNSLASAFIRYQINTRYSSNSKNTAGDLLGDVLDCIIPYFQHSENALKEACEVNKVSFNMTNRIKTLLKLKKLGLKHDLQKELDKIPDEMLVDEIDKKIKKYSDESVTLVETERVEKNETVNEFIKEVKEFDWNTQSAKTESAENNQTVIEFIKEVKDFDTRKQDDDIYRALFEKILMDIDTQSKDIDFHFGGVNYNGRRYSHTALAIKKLIEDELYQGINADGTLIPGKRLITKLMAGSICDAIQKKLDLAGLTNNGFLGLGRRDKKTMELYQHIAGKLNEIRNAKPKSVITQVESSDVHNISKVDSTDNVVNSDKFSIDEVVGDFPITPSTSDNVVDEQPPVKPAIGHPLVDIRVFNLFIQRFGNKEISQKSEDKILDDKKEQDYVKEQLKIAVEGKKATVKETSSFIDVTRLRYLSMLGINKLLHLTVKEGAKKDDDTKEFKDKKNKP